MPGNPARVCHWGRWGNLAALFAFPGTDYAPDYSHVGIGADDRQPLQV